MDPADTGEPCPALDELRHALASQGVLVGQHDQFLREVVETLRNLSASIHRIGTQVEQLSSQPTPPQPATQADPPTATPPPAPPVYQPREPNIPPPERYAGDLGTCRAFLTQCSLIFDQQPYTYCTDAAKIAFVMGLLKGKALDWATALRESQPNFSVSFTAFVSELRRKEGVFDYPVRGGGAKRSFRFGRALVV